MTALLEKEILLLDGGLGTTLEDNYGIKFNSSTPLWSSHLLITDPDTIEKAQNEFVKAGVDILLTPTYQASHDGFAKTEVNDEKVDFFEEICQYLDLGVDISRHAFNNRPGLVALSLGAYGATMSPSQEYGGQYDDMCDETKLEHWHIARIAMFWASWEKVNVVAFETIPRLEEVRAVRTAANVNRHERVFKPYWVTCVFPNNDERLPDGSSIEEVLEALFEERSWEDGIEVRTPWGVGINCTKVSKLEKLIGEFEAAAERLQIDLPRLVVAPNGSKGQTYDSSSQTWVGDKEEGGAWDEQVWGVVEGARGRGKWKGIVVGGCCKTSPEDIAKLRKKIDGR
ncbi:AdoMet-homocysteine methyltransferase [Neophaeococcomyces mojaviensis]|uniref:AdoMet-homocysteine methyltransferase n=1 Tax=Neophaeococcomyces mojaviensis TaxID=3383035 RepID=A0ACC3AAH5_9EURO|nr:AdoMet-homocysteine methyltransferase [Knufia sp. JES_112]